MKTTTHTPATMNTVENLLTFVTKNYRSATTIAAMSGVKVDRVRRLLAIAVADGRVVKSQDVSYARGTLFNVYRLADATDAANAAWAERTADAIIANGKAACESKADDVSMLERELDEAQRTIDAIEAKQFATAGVVLTQGERDAKHAAMQRRMRLSSDLRDAKARRGDYDDVCGPDQPSDDCYLPHPGDVELPDGTYGAPLTGPIQPCRTLTWNGVVFDQQTYTNGGRSLTASTKTRLATSSVRVFASTHGKSTLEHTWQRHDETAVSSQVKLSIFDTLGAALTAAAAIVSQDREAVAAEAQAKADEVPVLKIDDSLLPEDDLGCVSSLLGQTMRHANRLEDLARRQAAEIARLREQVRLQDETIDDLREDAVDYDADRQQQDDLVDGIRRDLYAARESLDAARLDVENLSQKTHELEAELEAARIAVTTLTDLRDRAEREAQRQEEKAQQFDREIARLREALTRANTSSEIRYYRAVCDSIGHDLFSRNVDATLENARQAFVWQGVVRYIDEAKAVEYVVEGFENARRQYAAAVSNRSGK